MYSIHHKQRNLNGNITFKFSSTAGLLLYKPYLRRNRYLQAGKSNVELFNKLY